MNTHDEIVAALIFKIKKLERVDAVARDIKDNGGLAGRGKEIAGSQTVEIIHEKWLALLDALDGASVK